MSADIRDCFQPNDALQRQNQERQRAAIASRLVFFAGRYWTLQELWELRA